MRRKNEGESDLVGKQGTAGVCAAIRRGRTRIWYPETYSQYLDVHLRDAAMRQERQWSDVRMECFM